MDTLKTLPGLRRENTWLVFERTGGKGRGGEGKPKAKGRLPRAGQAKPSLPASSSWITNNGRTRQPGEDQPDQLFRL